MNRKSRMLLIVILVVAGLFLIGRFGFKLGGSQYDSFEKFRKDAYLKLIVDIPAGASDQKFYSGNLGVAEYSLYAFTLDKDEYNRFINSMAMKYDLESNSEYDKGRNAYAEFYMKKVSDIQYSNSYGDSFPTDLKYEKVINDYISYYDVILFYPQYSGSFTYGVFANPNTGRIVVMNKGSIR